MIVENPRIDPKLYDDNCRVLFGIPGGMISLNTLEQSLVKVGDQIALEEFFKDWTLNGESLAEKLANPVISTGSSHLKLRLTSRIGTVVMDLDGTLKMRYLGSRALDIAEKKDTTSSLEILHVPKECFTIIESAKHSDLTGISVPFCGSYIIRTTVLSKCGLTEKAVAGKVLSGILKISADGGYLCLELSSPE